MPYSPAPTGYYDPTRGTYVPPTQPNFSFQPPQQPANWSPPAPGPNPNITYPWGSGYAPPPAGFTPTQPATGYSQPAAPGYPEPAPRGGGNYGWSGTGGMSRELMDAYKAYWGHSPGKEYRLMHQSLSNIMATRYGRPPRTSDYERLWQANRLASERIGESTEHPWTDAAKYDPLIASIARPIQAVAPPTSYQPSVGF